VRGDVVLCVRGDVVLCVRGDVVLCVRGDVVLCVRGDVVLSLNSTSTFTNCHLFIYLMGIHFLFNDGCTLQVVERQIPNS
jgi:hypothetical protein